MFSLHKLFDIACLTIMDESFDAIHVTYGIHLTTFACNNHPLVEPSVVTFNTGSKHETYDNTWNMLVKMH